MKYTYNIDMHIFLKIAIITFEKNFHIQISVPHKSGTDPLALLYEQALREAATICPRPLQVDLMTLKVVSKSRVTWATSVPIFVFLGLSVLCLGPMYATDRRQTRIIA